ncbi:MAG: GNAT family N-acetyltransferase [Chitinophagaceae bacterium]
MTRTDNHTIEIEEVKTARQLRQFIGFPYRFYRDDPNWVPPLRLTQRQLFASKHPFWTKNPHRFFLARRDGRYVGRIAAFVNREHNAHFSTRDGFFGYLEAENDAGLFHTLLDSATGFLLQQDCTHVIGPMNFDIHNELGVLVEGFGAPPYFMLTYNPPYYDEQLRAQGWQKLKDFYAYTLERPQFVPSPRMERVAQALSARHGIRVRHPDMKQFRQELEHFHAIYNDAFADHWGFVPIPRDEFVLLAKDMKSIIDPRLVLVAEYQGEPIAFLLCLPNLNEVLLRIRNGRLLPTGFFKILAAGKTIKTVRVITAAVKQAHRHRGIGALLYPALMANALQAGYQRGELSWVDEDNEVMNSIAGELGAVVYKTYRLYRKEVRKAGEP